MSIDAIATSETAETYNDAVFEQEVAQWFETVRKVDTLAEVHFEWKLTKPGHSYEYDIELPFALIAEKFDLQTRQITRGFKFDETDYDGDELREAIQDAMTFTLLFKAEAYDANHRLIGREAWHLKR